MLATDFIISTRLPEICHLIMCDSEIIIKNNKVTRLCLFNPVAYCHFVSVYFRYQLIFLCLFFQRKFPKYFTYRAKFDVSIICCIIYVQLISKPGYPWKFCLYNKFIINGTEKSGKGLPSFESINLNCLDCTMIHFYKK